MEGAYLPSTKKAGGKPSGFFVKLIKFLFKVALTVMVIFVLFAGYITWMFLTPYSGQSFNQQEWFALAEPSRHGECARGPMAGDIVDNILKEGMTRQEVETLLGPPDKDYYPSQYPHEYIYNLGMCSGLRWDFDFLHVMYDAQNRLILAVNVQH